MNALLDKNSLAVQSALSGAAAAGAAYAYGYVPGLAGSTLMQSAAIGAGGALGSMVGGDAASDADRYKRTAIIAAGGAAGAYATGGNLAMGALAAAVGHVAVQTALFYPVATIGPFLL